MFMRFGLAHRQAFSIIVTAPIHGPMEASTLGNGSTAKWMAKVPTHGPMAPSTSGNTRTANGGKASNTTPVIAGNKAHIQ